MIDWVSVDYRNLPRKQAENGGIGEGYKVSCLISLNPALLTWDPKIERQHLKARVQSLYSKHMRNDSKECKSGGPVCFNSNPIEVDVKDHVVLFAKHRICFPTQQSGVLMMESVLEYTSLFHFIIISICWKYF